MRGINLHSSWLLREYFSSNHGCCADKLRAGWRQCVSRQGRSSGNYSEGGGKRTHPKEKLPGHWRKGSTWIPCYLCTVTPPSLSLRRDIWIAHQANLYTGITWRHVSVISRKNQGKRRFHACKSWNLNARGTWGKYLISLCQGRKN